MEVDLSIYHFKSSLDVPDTYALNGLDGKQIKKMKLATARAVSWL